MSNYWDELMETDEHAASYMETYGEGIGAPTRQELGKFINDGESVLDVGCGPGWNFDHFLEYGPKVSRYLGLDYSERFVRVANKRHPGKFQMGDVRNLYRQARDEFDVVIMQDVLEHTNGYKKPLKEALRVARKRIIITFWRLGETGEDKTNNDGNDGWGSNYVRSQWEKYLDSLDIHWLHHQIEYPEGRKRDYYVIDKELVHGNVSAA